MCEGEQAAADRQRALKAEQIGANLFQPTRYWDTSLLGVPRFIQRGRGYDLQQLGQDREHVGGQGR